MSVYRIIDANINRAKEGLRVCEEVARFVLSDKELTRQFKKVRHDVDAGVRALAVPAGALQECRDSAGDSGKDISAGEFRRKTLTDIFYANMQRVKESIRVLEECAKLTDRRSALRFKALRYRIYDIEKKTARKIAALSHTG